MLGDPPESSGRPEDHQVLAGGGVVWRREDDGVIEVLLVHRPRYDDWSFPKGKLDPGESLVDCALREVEEETGFTCDIGRQLVDVHYRDNKDRTKLVRYWSMTVRAGAFMPNDEVDEIVWCPFAEAARRLTYGHDRPVLRALVQALVDEGPETA